MSTTPSDPRTTAVAAFLDGRYNGAVPATPEMVSAVLARIDGRPGPYVAPRLVEAAKAALATSTGTCAYCTHTLPVAELESFNPAGNLACRDLATCEARQAGEATYASEETMFGPQDADLTAHQAAQAGACSHGGHGWDGDTCSDLPAYPAGTQVRVTNDRSAWRGSTGTVIDRPAGRRPHPTLTTWVKMGCGVRLPWHADELTQVGAA